MIEVITTKDSTKDSTHTSESTYFKDAGMGALILEWIPILIDSVLVCISAATAVGIVLYSLSETDFSIRWYLLHDSPFAHPCIFFLAACAFSLYEGWKRYHLIEKEPFASANDTTLTLRFGKDSFLWDNIRKVDVEGDRKLTITSLDEGKIKEKKFDLKWLTSKEDFLHTLEEYCTAKNIPYHQSEISFFSRIVFLFDPFGRYPFV
jgi:hypothetical protein